MTLDTRIVLKNPDVSPEAVLEFINRELLRSEAPLRAEWPPPWLTPEIFEDPYLCAGVSEESTAAALEEMARAGAKLQ